MRCDADDGGKPCRREAALSAPVRLCSTHWLQVVHAPVSDALRAGLIDAAPPIPAGQLLNGRHGSVVYFIANGSRVKIGYTTNLRARISSLSLRSGNILLALSGGTELERGLHARFSRHRVGDTEWFALSPEIGSYIVSRLNSLDFAKTGGRGPSAVYPLIVEHLRTVWPDGVSAMHSHRLVEALANHDPEAYGSWLATDDPSAKRLAHEVQTARSTALSMALRPHSIPTTQITIRNCCGGAKGVRFTDLMRQHT